MSAKLIKIRTIIDFFLLNSNLSRELLIKRINKLIKIHNTQVKQGRFHEDAMEYISTAEQLIFLKNTKKRVYEFFEGTEYEDIIKARYRERGNYNYIAYELHMSQGKYYYKTLISICGSIEQRENLKEKIISQIKTICDKEKRIRNWMLYKAEQSEVR